jgi:CRISPR-associated protein Cmr6
MTMPDPITIRAKFSAQKRQESETHAGLWFDKYIGKQKRQDEKLKSGEVESRTQLIGEVAEQPLPSAYLAFFERWKQELKRLGVELREACVRGRMIVGLGSESVLETSICLHRTYGVPFIPGSALKGLAASYAHQRLEGEWQRGGKLHTVVFGKTDEAGYITFFDAFYVPGSGPEGKALSPDIITVHHQKYYQDASKPPSDSDDPNPVPFLSATGIYLLALAAPDLQQDASQHTRWIDITFQILAKALDEFGIGAKTSSGYGRMQLLDNETQSVGHSRAATTQEPPRPEERIRLKVPQFRAGQEIRGVVVPLADELRQRLPFEVRAVLSYESFPTTDVVIVVSEEEAQGWVPGQTRNCVFEREQEYSGQIIWFCKPRAKKGKKK